VTGAQPRAVTGQHRIEDLLRESAPQVLAALIRRYGQFDACEDAVQEALLAATLQWPGEGVPERPRSWLLAVASRALVDTWRADSARRRRETAAALDPTGNTPAADLAGAAGDDTLALLFLCCHPALSPPSQLALTLRAAGGLTTAQIAAAFLVPEATIAKRIVRAKQRIRDAGARFELPARPQRTARLGVVLHVLYLIFNEGYTASSGPALQRTDLIAEAIRLTRLLHRLLPGEAEAAGLLALMLLTDARRAARTGTDGRIVPLADQQRDLWDTAAIAEGQAILTRTLGTGPVGPYQLQAAIAALHDEAPAAEATDWPQILALYDVLSTVAPGPVVTLGRAVALAHVHGPRAGLALLGTLDADERMAHSHRLEAVRAHLLEQAGDTIAARDSYLRAAKMTASLPEQRYLELRAARLHHPAPLRSGRCYQRPGISGRFGGRERAWSAAAVTQFRSAGPRSPAGWTKIMFFIGRPVKSISRTCSRSRACWAAWYPSRTMSSLPTTPANMCPPSRNARPPNIFRSVTSAPGGTAARTRSARSSS
jgi:predicted RNA polymerase sigma factor